MLIRAIRYSRCRSCNYFADRPRFQGAAKTTAKPWIKEANKRRSEHRGEAPGWDPLGGSRHTPAKRKSKPPRAAETLSKAPRLSDPAVPVVDEAAVVDEEVTDEAVIDEEDTDADTDEPMSDNDVINLAHRWQFFLDQFEASVVELKDPETIIVIDPTGTVQTYELVKPEEAP
jgi:hypothetical protein